MRRRAWIMVGVATAVVLAAAAAAYLTGFIIVGDPFSGVWNTDAAATLGPDGEWKTTGELSGGSLIKRTSSGYVFTMVWGAKARGWHPLRRHGRRLEAEYDDQRITFEYQPWSGHLLWTYYDHGILRADAVALEKVTDSTSVPPQTN